MPEWAGRRWQKGACVKLHKQFKSYPSSYFSMQSMYFLPDTGKRGEKHFDLQCMTWTVPYLNNLQGPSQYVPQTTVFKPLWQHTSTRKKFPFCLQHVRSSYQRQSHSSNGCEKDGVGTETTRVKIINVGQNWKIKTPSPSLPVKTTTNHYHYCCYLHSLWHVIGLFNCSTFT